MFPKFLKRSPVYKQKSINMIKFLKQQIIPIFKHLSTTNVFIEKFHRLNSLKNSLHIFFSVSFSIDNILQNTNKRVKRVKKSKIDKNQETYELFIRQP